MSIYNLVRIIPEVSVSQIVHQPLSLTIEGDSVRALYPSNLLNKKSLFFINTDIGDIGSLPNMGSNMIIETNWVMLGSAMITLTPYGEPVALFNKPREVSIYAIGSCCIETIYTEVTDVEG